MGHLVRPPHRTDTERGTRHDSAHAFAAAVTELATKGNRRRMLVRRFRATWDAMYYLDRK
jgi:hypothetical protein